MAHIDKGIIDQFMHNSFTAGPIPLKCKCGAPLEIAALGNGHYILGHISAGQRGECMDTDLIFGNPKEVVEEYLS